MRKEGKIKLGRKEKQKETGTRIRGKRRQTKKKRKEKKKKKRIRKALAPIVRAGESEPFRFQIWSPISLGTIRWKSTENERVRSLFSPVFISPPRKTSSKITIEDGVGQKTSASNSAMAPAVFLFPWKSPAPIPTTMPFRCFKCKSAKGKTVRAL